MCDRTRRAGHDRALRLSAGAAAKHSQHQPGQQVRHACTHTHHSLTYAHIYTHTHTQIHTNTHIHTYGIGSNICTQMQTQFVHKHTDEEANESRTQAHILTPMHSFTLSILHPFFTQLWARSLIRLAHTDIDTLIRTFFADLQE